MKLVLSAFLSILFLVTIGLSQDVVADNLTLVPCDNCVRYNEGLLKYSDFQEKLTEQEILETKKTEDAHIKIDFYWDYEWERTDTPQCGIYITKFEVSAFMHRDLSVILPGMMGAAILNHEQRHFDLEEAKARHANYLMSEIVNKFLSGACSQSDFMIDDGIHNLFYNILTEKSDPLFWLVEDSLGNMVPAIFSHEQYDEERDGDYPGAPNQQPRWDKKIDCLLDNFDNVMMCQDLYGEQLSIPEYTPSSVKNTSEITDFKPQPIKCDKGTVDVNGQCIPEPIGHTMEEYGEMTSGNAKEENGGGCLIATATFGSELAPQVQQLRELRDNTLLQTELGTHFMNLFNGIYYSFSPVIADYERENPVFKEAVRLAITPMISSLSILNYVDMDSNESVLGYGISLIVLNVMMYVGIPILAVMKFRK